MHGRSAGQRQLYSLNSRTKHLSGFYSFEGQPLNLPTFTGIEDEVVTQDSPQAKFGMDCDVVNGAHFQCAGQKINNS